MSDKTRGFSLLEVVVAIGVFALGIIVVIGLFAPLARSVTSNAEAEVASQVAEAIKAELAQRAALARSFSPVAGLLKDADAMSDQTSRDIRTDAQLLFAPRDGLLVAGYDAAVWGGSDRAKFFEIALVRNASLSPADLDATAIVLCYTARIRWPAFIADDATGNLRGALPAGQNPAGQQVLFVNGSIRR